MPSWIETKKEIENKNGDYDGVRRGRIEMVEKITGRPLVVYATAFLDRQKVVACQGEVGIDHNDPIGFDEVISDIPGDSLDVLIHSPGGSPEAAEGIVSLLRSRFTHLRFFVPHMAKSAATMICCAGDEIFMDERSELGPIDPQMQLVRGDGVTIMAPAQAILRQFDLAKESLAENQKRITAWLPILQPLGPSLLTECESANDLSFRLVEDWLKKYMFSNNQKKEDLAKSAASYLSDSTKHLSHGRRIGVEQLLDLKMSVTNLRDLPEIRNAIWSLYLAVEFTLQDTTAFKIIENCHGAAFIRSIIIQQLVNQSQQDKLQPAQQTNQKPHRKRH